MNTRIALRSWQRGLSLIELLIAMSISALLILGLVEIFSSTRSAFAASEALARVQENSRFAMEFLRRDTRMAGHMGCMNEFAHVAAPLEDPRWNNLMMTAPTYPPTPTQAQMEAAFNTVLTAVHPTVRADMPIEAYEFTGTAPGDAYAIADSNPTGANNVAAWSPALHADLDLIGAPAAAGAILPGSDVLVVRYFDEAPVLLPQLGPGGTPWPVGEGGMNAGVMYSGDQTANFPLFHLYGATNCRRASMFQVVANSGGGQLSLVGGLNSGTFAAQEVYGLGTMVFRYRAAIYYVGRGTNGPSLFRKGLRESPTLANAATWDAPEELIEGVESMQLLLATADAPTAAGRIDDVTGYQTAAALQTGAATEFARSTVLRRVAGVRVSLLMRSPDTGAGVDPVVPTVVVGDVVVTPPLDRRLRHVYDSIIQLRNRQRA